MPITVTDQAVFVDLLQADDSVSLAALVGTVARRSPDEGGVAFPIANAEELQQKLQGVYDRIVAEIEVDPDTLRSLLLGAWPTEGPFPISDSVELLRGVLLKIRVQMSFGPIATNGTVPDDGGPGHDGWGLGPDGPVCFRYPRHR